jgi:hypothetical protein
MRALVSEWESSGLKLAEFARAQGVAPATLSWWRWTIGRRERERRSPAPGAFVGVQLVGAAVAPPRPFEVVLPGRRVVRVPSGFDAAELARLLSALEAAPC